MKIVNGKYHPELHFQFLRALWDEFDYKHMTFEELVKNFEEMWHWDSDYLELMFLTNDGEPMAILGMSVGSSLHYGRVLSVEAMVILPQFRGNKRLVKEIIRQRNAYARLQGVQGIATVHHIRVGSFKTVIKEV